MKLKTLRIAIPLAVLAVVGVGFVLNTGIGTLSAIGWGDVSLLCPLGALGTMLASKTVIPKAVISLGIAVAAIAVLGRAFCAWVCPVPLVSRIRDMLKKDGSGKTSGKPGDASRAPLESADNDAAGCKAQCASCAKSKEALDSRHVVLGGALLSAAVFGFPVFCLVCPIGLTFATILLVLLLFSGGDVTWSVVVVPALLVAEVVLFRKWCSRVCPLSALMSLLGKLNRTLRPTIDDSKCLESSKGAECGRCAASCESGIDPRHPELGAAWSECTKCRACVEACPSRAITMPLLPPKKESDSKKSEQPHAR